MPKVFSEYEFMNTIVLGSPDQYSGFNTYLLKGIKVISYLNNGGGWGWYVDAGIGNDTIDAKLIYGPNTLLGGEGKDTIYGGWGDDWVDGGAGVDVIQTGAGNDSVKYDLLDRYVSGGDGVDTIDASSAAPTRIGQGVAIDLESPRDAYEGFENIIGSAFADTLSRALKKSASLAAFPLPEKSISNKRFKPAAVPV